LIVIAVGARGRTPLRRLRVVNQSAIAVGAISTKKDARSHDQASFLAIIRLFGNGFWGCGFGCFSGFLRCRCLRHFLNGGFDDFGLLRGLRPTGKYGIHSGWLVIAIVVPTATPTAIPTTFAGSPIAPIGSAAIGAGRAVTAGLRRGIDAIGFLNGLLNHDSTILKGLMILH
jgi:hypothetical protein